MELLVHGGAGSAPDDPEPRQETLEAARDAGLAAADPTAAVRAAIRHLEADPRYNAGVGGAVQDDGVVRTDAGFMTDDGDCGAACGMPGVEHAVDVAHAVAMETPHVLLAGDGAVEFAEGAGVAADRDLTTEATRARYDEAGLPGIDAGFDRRLA